VLPFDEGRVLDPFAGSGSTLAACLAVGVDSVGIERNIGYYKLALEAIPRLAALDVGAKLAAETGMLGDAAQMSFVMEQRSNYRRGKPLAG